MGITKDEKLNFAEHIIKFTCKISRSVGILSKLKNILPFTAYRKLYYSMFHSHLLYGTVLWGFTYDNNLKRLIILQNKAVKYSSCRWTAAGPRYTILPPITNLKTEELALTVYEVAKLMHKTHEKSY